MRCAPKPSAAPSTAAGATSEPIGRPSVLMTSTDTTTYSTAMATDEITDATACRCLTASDCTVASASSLAASRLLIRPAT